MENTSDQRYQSPDGVSVFPDELGDTIVAQALLVGKIRRARIGPSEQPCTTNQPGRIGENEVTSKRPTQ